MRGSACKLGGQAIKPINASAKVADAEGRLEWLLGKLLEASLRRRSRLKMPVLIGGTALRRAYRLTRPSTDLDFAVADKREMRAILNTVTKLARERWPSARTALRQDEEQGWSVNDETGEPMLHIGGLVMAPETLELAHWVRDTWTLPMGRLAAMKITTGIELRSKARDVYDMGFIAEQYPGDITMKQADDIRNAGWEAMESNNRWNHSYQQDAVLRTQSLKEIGSDTAQAATAALEHLEGARHGRWANQAVAAAGLQMAVDHEPAGKWLSRPIDERTLCAWIAPNGRPVWEGTIENEARVIGLLRQANIDGHPHVQVETARAAEHERS